MSRKLTLVCAPAGFGKTTLVSKWIAASEHAIAWLSLDEKDNDPSRFLLYLAAALQTVIPHVGEGIFGALQSPQPPSIESILTILLNELAASRERVILILDDYHIIDSQAVNTALTFFIDQLPPQVHLVITTRENPSIPLARYRAQGQLTELRAADLRFTRAEAAEFLNQAMGLNLSTENIAALENRTEGWIAGLQMAALSMQGRTDTAGFIQAFTGGHTFVMDYLLEEVLQRQSENIQTFLLYTSILDRMCGALCEAVLADFSVSGQETLQTLERANLFIFPLDNERRWYRYHHLFADLLRQRLRYRIDSSTGKNDIAQLHIRASIWYEANHLEIEAFHHAAAANDIERAARLIESDGIPLHFREVVVSGLNWLATLPTAVLDSTPSLWVKYAGLLLVVGQTTGVEEKLQAAETALKNAEMNAKTRDLIGRIAAARATVALTQYRINDLFTQARRALAYLPPENLPFRAVAMWGLGCAYAFQPDRAAAGRTFTEAIAISNTAGDTFTTILAATGLGQVQEAENQLGLAAETFQHVLGLAGHQPLQIIYEAHLGMARILYEWNDLESAQQYGYQSLQLARQYDSVIDRFVVCQVFLARVKLAQGDLSGAAAIISEAAQFVRQHNFVHRIPEVAAVQVLVLLQQGNVTAAAQLAQTHELPVSLARVYLAQNDPAALEILELLRRQLETQNLQDERLRVIVLQAVALHAHGSKSDALHVLSEALALAESGGFIRLFVDEGAPMAVLLSEAISQGAFLDYIRRLLAAFPSDALPKPKTTGTALIDPLSERELEVLRLIAEGLTNQDIATRLYLSLHTVKVHVRNINGKLDASNRTQAVAKARAINLLSS